MFMDWLRKAPTAVVVSVIVTCGVVALGVLGTFLLLSLNGEDTTEFRQWVNTVGQLLIFPVAGVGTVAAVSAARSSKEASDQTNGQLHEKDAEIADLKRELLFRMNDQQKRI